MHAGYLFRGGTVLSRGKAIRGRSVAVEGRRIVALGAEAERLGRRRARHLQKVDLDGGYLAPGLVDLHTHGAAGVDFYGAGADELARVVSAHYLRHGVTRILVSLIPGPWKEFLAVIGRIASALHAGAGQGVAAGIHLEGPFLDPDHPGALPVAHFRTYSARAVEELLEAGAGTVKTMTVAPERPGGLSLLAHLRRRGVVAAFGHTGASHAQASRALAEGIGYVTHLFNAMDGIHHRRPGPVPALLADPRVRVELIADGYHLDPAVLGWVARALGPERVCLVSDSVSPCGQRPGRYVFAGKEVRLARGRVTLPDGTLAGSVLTLDRALRLQVEATGIPPEEAAMSASWTPAAVVGWERTVGSVARGRRADLLVLSPALRVRETYLAGERVVPGSSRP